MANVHFGSWAASSLFQFHLSRQGFGLPCSGRQCEISCLDLIVLCWVYFREKNTCSPRVRIQGELQIHSTSEDLDLCPWQVLLGVAFAVSQWISTLWNGGFPHLHPFRLLMGWLLQTSLNFLLPSMEHKWKTTALICQEIHLRTPDSYITSSCCRAALSEDNCGRFEAVVWAGGSFAQTFAGIVPLVLFLSEVLVQVSVCE